MSEDRIVKYQTSHGEVKLSPGIIRKYLVSGQASVTDQEVVMFLKLCEGQKLNPFLREAYLVKYGSQAATMVVGKDVFTRRAAENPQYNGMQSGVCIKKASGDIEYRPGTLLLKEEELVGGWAKVYVKNWDYPIESVVSLDEYIGKKSDGTVTKQWKQMPATMICKVAKVQALREAFPRDFQGLYDAAEMQLPTDQDLPSEKVTPSEDKAETPPEAPQQPQDDDIEDAEYEVEEDEPEATEQPELPTEAGDSPIDALRTEAGVLLEKMGVNDMLTPSQVDTLRGQLSTMKSEAALKAMIKNFSGKLAQAEDTGV